METSGNDQPVKKKRVITDKHKSYVQRNAVYWKEQCHYVRHKRGLGRCRNWSIPYATRCRIHGGTAHAQLRYMRKMVFLLTGSKELTLQTSPKVALVLASLVEKWVLENAHNRSPEQVLRSSTNIVDIFRFMDLEKFYETRCMTLVEKALSECECGARAAAVQAVEEEFD